MAVQLGWQPKSVPRAPGKGPALAGGRRDFALEITGNNADVKNGAEGTVKIVEAQGDKDAAGAERLIATFHGTWHRNGSGKGASLTFEIFVPKGTSISGWERHGYDPECIPGLGVDGFALTFVGGVFPVNFPFFADSSTEGRFLELQALAEWEAGNVPKEIARSPVLSIPIRRHHRVESTTQAKAPAKGNEHYEDDLVGNVILFHESFLVSAARVKKGHARPAGTVSAERIPVPASKPGAFAKYPALANDRQLRIFLEPALVEDLLPEASDPVWTTKLLKPGGGPKLRPEFVTLSRRAINDNLIEVFATDAGFTGTRVTFLDSSSAADRPMVAKLTGSPPFTVPFFTFLVQQNNGLTEVGHAQEIQFPNTQATFDGFDWIVESPFPIGSGDKTLKRGIQFRSSNFGDHFGRFVMEPRPKGAGPLTLADVESAVQKQAEKLAETIAHEIGHSLGLMHESEITEKEDCTEVDVGPLRSIMCSKTDDDPYGAGVRFSNQAKIIWRDCFGVTPRLPTDSLRNKTWKDDEWRTVDWGERKQRVMHAIGETSLASYPLHNGNVSPYNKKMPGPQPGTYVPPPQTPPP